jgi:oxygen-independent coproporphyrinogen-3 oxidase
MTFVDNHYVDITRGVYENDQEEVAARIKLIATPLSVYVHFPFCSSLCDFCFFYRVEPGPGQIQRYVAALESDVAVLIGASRPRVTTVYVGGGTPSLMSGESLQLFSRVLAHLHPMPGAEFSFEAHPSDLNPLCLKMLSNMHVTRLSIGAQTFDACLLARMHRRSCARTAADIVAMARDAGIDVINIDLLYDLPGGGPNTTISDVMQAIEAHPDAVTLYHCGRKTAHFSASYPSTLNPSDLVSIWRNAKALLQDAGYLQVSTRQFVRNLRKTCRHDLGIWRGGSVLGLGPSAFSYFDKTVHVNEPNVARYCEDRHSRGRTVSLTPTEDALRFCALSFRTLSVDLAAYERRNGCAVDPSVSKALAAMTAQGLLQRENSSLTLTESGIEAIKELPGILLTESGYHGHKDVWNFP